MEFCPHGILPAMITPLKKNGEIDHQALRRLIDHLLAGGVHGIFAIGTTGEFYALSTKAYQEILETTVDQVAGRVPVYAGANSITTQGSIELAHIAQAVGVDAISVLTPIFISPDQEQVYNHFKAIAAETDLPVLIYNNLPKTHVDIKPQTAARLADIDNIVGIKDSTGDMTIMEEYIRLTRDKSFHLMMGRDTLIYGALCYGATGGVAACANVAPAMVCDIYNKFMQGDHKGALEAQFKLAPLRIAFSLGCFPAVIKEALAMIGIPVGDCFAPAGPLTTDQKAALRQILTEMELLG